MLFNSLEFAVFFPIVCLLFFAVPMRWRVPWLLIASCAFYMAFIPAYILILGVTILIDYVAGIYLDRVQGRNRCLLLWVSILSTCAVLFIFKYYNFFIGSFNGIAEALGGSVHLARAQILLPIGLSFHTFQSLSYVVEVYRGRQAPERNFIRYATYVMFFPQLVAGPIERPQNLLHQFIDLQPFDSARACSGLKRMAWGFFKKVVVADRLALYVNDVYGAPQQFTGLQLTIATVFFAYQIYCDFSGYSDIAVGSARVLGFRLMENFRTPYHSTSVSEFWRRWHISLSTWFKDYVYVPLGGSRVSRWRWALNVWITFGISGLWHGANWTYVLWGLLNGTYLIVGELTQGMRDSVLRTVGLARGTFLRHGLQWMTTFLLTCLAWILFRSRSFEDAWYVMTHLGSHWDFSRLSTEQFLLRQMPFALGGILILEIGQWINLRFPVVETVERWPLLVRWPAYLTLLFTVILCGVYRQAQFIYFQF